MKLKIEPADGPAFHKVLETESLVIGRASTSDLALADPFLSRHHARVFLQDGRLLIEDLTSRNGTELNGNPVLEPTAVQAGDVVRVSGSRISFLDEATESEETVPGATILKPAYELLKEADTGAEPSEVHGEKALRDYATRLKLLCQVHEALSNSLELDELLSMILDCSFEQLNPEQAVVFLQQADGEFQRAASLPPGDVEEIPLSRSLIDEVCGRGMAALVLDTATDERFAGAQSIIMSGMRSMIAAPLLDVDKSMGMIVLCSKAATREFNEEDMQFLVSMASIAALKLRNVSLLEEAAQRRRLEQEVALARRIQESLLPAELPKITGFELFAQNLPSRGVSGDFYQVIRRPEAGRCMLFLADVSGKGIAAAMLTHTLEAYSTGPIEDGKTPPEICNVISRRLHRRTPPEKYATAFLADLDEQSGRAEYTNAGHNPALLVRGDGSIEELSSSGMPLGLVADADYVASQVTLEIGDVLVIYTDGITEAENAKEEEYGLERLREIVEKHRTDSCEAIAAAINEDLETFVQQVPPADDRTLIIARRTALK